MLARRLLVTTAALTIAACASEAPLDPGPGADGGPTPDAGAAEVVDAASPDATPGEDGGASADASVSVDGSTPDAGIEDGGEVPDSGTHHPPVILPAGGPVSTARFATVETCATCHANAPGATAMRDADGNEIGPVDLWASSMMANSTRDPFFRAVLSAELVATPAAHDAIEDKCFTCHAPMAEHDAIDSNEHFSLAELYAGGDRSGLALDGASCTACHLIEDVGLGSPASFSGGYALSTTRQVYGPHDNLFSMPMVRNSGFTPRRGDHVNESRLCATCHTLHTDTLDGAGAATGGRLPEQTPYLEWRNSDFSTEVASPGPSAASCQSCHLPTVDEQGRTIRTAIAHAPNGSDFGPVSPREPYGRHVLVGGNTLVPAILRDNPNELAPKASAAAFDATIARARDQLENRTARLTVLRTEAAGADRAVVLRIENLTGHKLPTAYPSRRVWLRVRVADAGGATVYEVGGFDTRGRLVDAGGQVLPSELAAGPTLPHVDRVPRGGAPLVYQSVMADDTGAATFTLLRGATYAKDNRLLPTGWSAGHPDAADTAPVGTSADGSFLGGADEVTVIVPAPAGGATHTVQAELLYQVISPRWAAEIGRVDTPEAAAFARYYAAADVRPERLASAQAELR